MTEHGETHGAHKPHILPLKLYLAVGGALLFLTAVTVSVAQIPLGPFNTVVALAIAFFKAALVALFFMHLYYDNRLFMLTFVISLMALAVFITLTMFDTMARDTLYQEVGHPIRTEAPMYDSLRADTTHDVGHE